MSGCGGHQDDRTRSGPGPECKIHAVHACGAGRAGLRGEGGAVRITARHAFEDPVTAVWTSRVKALMACAQEPVKMSGIPRRLSDSGHTPTGRTGVAGPL